MRRWLVRGALRTFGGAHGFFELAQFTFGLVETIAERTDERVELADQLVLECELDLEIFEALGIGIGHREHGTRPPATIGDVRALLLCLLVACANDTAPAPPPERTDVIKRNGDPLTLVGKTLEVGDAMPDATVRDGKLDAIKLGQLEGKVVVLSVVPSIDTRVCEAQTHKVSDLIAQMPAGVEVFTISRDLPFAQTRFAEEAMAKTKFGSDFKEHDIGRLFGLDVKETGLLARSVWVVGTDGKIVYREIVANQSTEPNYDDLLAAVKRAAGA